jgi:hypothetical protein
MISGDGRSEFGLQKFENIEERERREKNTVANACFQKLAVSKTIFHPFNSLYLGKTS